MMGKRTGGSLHREPVVAENRQAEMFVIAQELLRRMLWQEA